MQLLLDEATHLQHLVAHFFQVLVEAPGNVMGEIGRFHGIYLDKKSIDNSNHAGYLRLRRAST